MYIYKHLIFRKSYFQIKMNSKLAYNLDFLSGALSATCNAELRIIPKNDKYAIINKFSPFDLDALHNHTLKWLDVDVNYQGRIGKKKLI